MFWLAIIEAILWGVWRPSLRDEPRYRIPRVAHRLPEWVQRPPGQAKAVPADDPAMAVASSTCGQAGQNTFARLSGIPLCSLHTGGTPRGYSVGRLPSGNFLQASQRGRKQVGRILGISLREREREADASARWTLNQPTPAHPAALPIITVPSSRTIGNFGLALGRDLYAKRQRGRSGRAG